MIRVWPWLFLARPSSSACPPTIRGTMWRLPWGFDPRHCYGGFLRSLADSPGGPVFSDTMAVTSKLGRSNLSPLLVGKTLNLSLLRVCCGTPVYFEPVTLSALPFLEPVTPLNLSLLTAAGVLAVCVPRRCARGST